MDYTYYDHPGKYSLVLYCSGCNMKCYGCHNRTIAGWDYESKSRDSEKIQVSVEENSCELSKHEIELAIKNSMLDMIILCGWEFLLYPIDQIKQTIDYVRETNPNVLIRVDTNGTFPEKVEELTNRGKVDWFAIDIKWPYWNDKFEDISSDIVWITPSMSKKMFPKIVESLEISKQLEYTIYRTVVYPTANDEYFTEIKSYVQQNLKKPHSFSNYVEI